MVKLDIIPFVARDTAGEKYSVSLSIVANKGDKILDFMACFGCLVFPCCLPEAKKLALRFMKRSIPVFGDLLLY